MQEPILSLEKIKALTLTAECTTQVIQNEWPNHPTRQCYNVISRVRCRHILYEKDLFTAPLYVTRHIGCIIPALQKYERKIILAYYCPYHKLSKNWV